MPDDTALTHLVILFAAAVIVVPLLRYGKASPVLGFLLAGVIVGPSGFELVPESELTATLAEFGVMFLLFAIGLELSIERLRAMRYLVFGLGAAQCAACAIVIGGFVYLMGAGGAASILIGAALALSSTAFVMQLLDERGELASQHGRSAFAILLFQDLAAVPLIALVGVLGGDAAEIGMAVLTTFGVALGVFAGILIIGRVVLRPALRLVATSRSAEIFTVVTLLLVIGTGWLTHLFGLSIVLGAFLAGILLAETEYRHQVEADIRPFRGVLLGLFFTTIGMSIDLSVAMERWGELVLIVLGLMLTKALLITLVAWVSSRRWTDAVRTGVFLAQGGEFAFVVFELAGREGLIEADLRQILVVSVAVSMLLTPLLVGGAARAIRHVEAKRRGDQKFAAPDAEDVQNHALIAGFGRTGRTIAEILVRQGFNYVALDQDPAAVAEARSKGLPVYYGNVNHSHVLEGAGIAHAQVAIVTVNDTIAAERTVHAIKRDWPRLPIIARAKDVPHAEHLQRAGAAVIVPEVHEASLRLGTEALTKMGLSREEAHLVIEDYQTLFKDAWPH